MPSRPIRLLIVEDSPVALAILQRILREAPDIEVVGLPPATDWKPWP